MAGVRRIIEAEGITQREAAERFGVTQPRISDLVRGKIELFNDLIRRPARGFARQSRDGGGALSGRTSP